VLIAAAPAGDPVFARGDAAELAALCRYGPNTAACQPTLAGWTRRRCRPTHARVRSDVGRLPPGLNTDSRPKAAKKHHYRIDQVAEKYARLNGVGNDEDKDEDDEQHPPQPAGHGTRLAIPVRAENPVTSCDLQILVYETAEAISS
jgi:hypothetical protein